MMRQIVMLQSVLAPDEAFRRMSMQDTPRAAVQRSSHIAASSWRNLTCALPF